MKRRHVMPFGASVTDAGVAFGLWAPAAQRVDVRRHRAGGRCDTPLARDADGWFAGIDDGARAGDGYTFLIDGGREVPDPASRWQPDGVHRPSRIVDPSAFEWTDGDWRGRPWHEAVLYELHVGTFTPEGTYAAAIGKLDHLAALGVTAIELMPLAECPGDRNWGYDGVYLFAPETRYGAPDDLKRLVCAAHARGLMVLLDVVFNHLGPEGNHLGVYAPQFFTDRHRTPWGKAIDFDGKRSRTVREFYIHCALYWLEEFHLDGLRLDAVNTMGDAGERHILTEIAEAVRARLPDRHVHLVLENDNNAALVRGVDDRPHAYTAQWNDDFHHALHGLITGESGGYYADYADAPGRHLARCLAEGFAYQGEASRYRGGRNRGEDSRALPPGAFVSFIQNHDQVGNRAFGERISAIVASEAARAAAALLLLAPFPPMLFMGEEWAASTPFLFFCDFEADLAAAVREGRLRDYGPLFAPAVEAGRDIPDPIARDTFAACVLDWDEPTREPHQAVLAWYTHLLALRRHHLVPRLPGTRATGATAFGPRAQAIHAAWRLGDGSLYTLLANLSGGSIYAEVTPPGSLIGVTVPGAIKAGAPLPPWTVGWFLAPRGA